MILVDTSIWVDHLNGNDPALADLLDRGQVLAHRFVIGELALGNLRQRTRILDALLDLPQAIHASDEEVLELIDRNGLAGTGIGYVDSHLLAAVRLTNDALLWTRDKRLQIVSAGLGLAVSFQ